MSRPKKDPADKGLRLTVYVHPEIMKKIKDLAKRTRRSVSMTCVIMIEYALMREDRSR